MFFTICTLPIFLFLLVNLHKVYQIQKNGIKTTGKVVEIILDYDYNATQMIEFKIEKGKFFNCKVKYPGFRTRKVGDEIRKIYLPGKPENFIPDNFRDKYYPSIISALIGLPFIVAAASFH